MDKLLKDKEVFVFDWDGTILDSMEMKATNFGLAFCSICQSVKDRDLANKVMEGYLQLSGYPRKHIFFQIVSMLGMNVKQDSFIRFNDSFAKLNKDTLPHARIFQDALDLLEELIRRGRKIFISSSVPPQELLELVASTLPMAIRVGVASMLGSRDGFSKGSGHLSAIMKEADATQQQLIVIGDDLADRDLSTQAGIDCILVDRSGGLNKGSAMVVSSLFQIKDALSSF